MRKDGIILALAFIILSACQYYLGYQNGYNKAKAEIQAKINLDKKTLENHAKTIENIHAESDSSANNRLRKNLRSN